MPSIKSRILLFVMKHRHWLKLQFKPKVIDWNKREAILNFRHECEKGAQRFGRLPEGIRVSPVLIDKIKAEWLEPSQTENNKVIFFCHGGGYVSGSCSDHRVHVAKFVKGSNVKALLFEYRLAPEYQYPAALDDSLKAYQWLLEQKISPDNIIFVGDSAGGGLCLATLLALKDKEIELPASAVVLSPWTDLKCTGESYATKAKKCLSPEGIWTAFSKHYAGANDPAHPWISPLYGNLKGLPPLQIYVGENEILYDDAVVFAHKAKTAGVDVTLKVGDGLFHCYPVCAPLFPEATEAMDEICRFIRNT